MDPRKMVLFGRRLLFVEDIPESVWPVIRALHKVGYRCKVVNFEQAPEYIEKFVPDVLILDLKEGSGPEFEKTGLSVFSRMWEEQCRPVVVYSAQPELLSDDFDHPFVHFVQKGSGSVERILELLHGLRNHVEAVLAAEAHVRKQFGIALREVAPHAIDVYKTDAEKMGELIVRAGRRRLAASLDELTEGGEGLASWEQYLCPPVSRDTQLGDILRKKDKSEGDVESFRIVLTPSCDLVREGRGAKVDAVLVARCITIKSGIVSTNLGEVKVPKFVRLLPAILRHGYLENILFLPAFKGKIPHMVADLKSLELLAFKQIDEEYGRVASIDSPFRELVSWAYMNVGCRPGLPDREIGTWCDEVCEAYKGGN